MLRLNRLASRLAQEVGVNACTDITGFGLLGHASEMAAGSGVALELEAARVPLFDGVLPLVARHRSGGMSSNRSHIGAGVRFGAEVGRDVQDLLFDPQTSGGLLIAVSPDDLPALTTALVLAGVQAPVIGSVVEPDDSGTGALITVV